MPADRLRRGGQRPGAVAEDLLDRPRLGGVAERRRRPVRVDAQPDARRPPTAPALAASSPRRRSTPDRAAPCSARRSRRRSRAPPRTPSHRARGRPRLLQREDAPRLAHDESGPRRVERTGGQGGVLVLCHEPAHRAEPREDERVDAGLGAPASTASAAPRRKDQLGSLPDRVRPGRARRHGRVVRPAQTSEIAIRWRSRPGRSGMKNGETRSGRCRGAPPAARRSPAGRRSPSRRRSRRAGSKSSEPRPATPPALLQASRTFRSMRRASFGGATEEASKPFTSPAIRTGNSLASKLLDEVDAALLCDGGAPGRRRVQADGRDRAQTMPPPFASAIVVDDRCNPGNGAHDDDRDTGRRRAGHEAQAALLPRLSQVSAGAWRIPRSGAARRRSHGTFRLLVVDEDERPDLVEPFGITTLPTLVVVQGRREHARLERPRGCHARSSCSAPGCASSVFGDTGRVPASASGGAPVLVSEEQRPAAPAVPVGLHPVDEGLQGRPVAQLTAPDVEPHLPGGRGSCGPRAVDLLAHPEQRRQEGAGAARRSRLRPARPSC